jgi:hypothetical protein
MIDYFYTYRNNMEYIPERLDVSFVKAAMLPYLARYIPKWEGYDSNNYSINRETHPECARIYDGYRGVWNGVLEWAPLEGKGYPQKRME